MPCGLTGTGTRFERTAPPGGRCSACRFAHHGVTGSFGRRCSLPESRSIQTSGAEANQT